MVRNGGGDRTSLDLYLGTSGAPWSGAGRDRSDGASGGEGGDGGAIRASPVPAEVARRYRLGERLGAGSFGVVHRATDRVTGETVAVKLLKPGTGAARVRREVVALRGLRLPGVVRLLDEGMADDRPFLVMELVEGRDFPGVARPAPWATIEDATMRLLEVLGRVHAADALHLDIKPANVRVTDAGAVVLLDLGLAHGPALGGAAGSLGGTECYMAPELHQRQASARSDLYSVGMMIWEALAGTPPLTAHVLAHVRPGDAPDDVWALIRALLDSDPGRRPVSAWAALDRLLAGAGGRGKAWAPPLPPDADILDQAALRACFHGPERVLHLPADAAAQLHQRTGGRRDLVLAELHRWIRMGLAVPAGERLRMERAAIDQLESADAAARVARPDEVTLARLIVKGESDAAVRMALAAADDHLLQGRFERARLTLEQALLLIRRGDVSASVGADVEPALLCLWARMALEMRGTAALEVALYEVGRAMYRTPAIDAVAVLLRDALHAEGGASPRAGEHLDELAPFADLALELLRHGVRLRLAARQGEEAAVLARIEKTLAPMLDRDDVQARVLGWQGHARYQQGCFEEAAALQEQAARRAPARTQRLGFLHNSASAWMEVGRYERAETLARQLLAQARQHRYPVFEGHAEWLLRSVAYRARQPLAPDLELVGAIGSVGVPYLEGLVYLTEAAVAWRRGVLDMAGDLAARARKRFEAADLRAGRVLAQALVLACRAGYVPGSGRYDSPASSPNPATEELARLAHDVLAQPIADVDWQVLGILARLPGGTRWQADAEHLARAAARHGQRRELISPRAVLDSH